MRPINGREIPTSGCIPGGIPHLRVYTRKDTHLRTNSGERYTHLRTNSGEVHPPTGIHGRDTPTYGHTREGYTTLGPTVVYTHLRTNSGIYPPERGITVRNTHLREA